MDADLDRFINSVCKKYMTDVDISEESDSKVFLTCLDSSSEVWFIHIIPSEEGYSLKIRDQEPVPMTEVGFLTLLFKEASRKLKSQRKLTFSLRDTVNEVMEVIYKNHMVYRIV